MQLVPEVGAGGGGRGALPRRKEKSTEQKYGNYTYLKLQQGRPGVHVTVSGGQAGQPGAVNR